MDIVILSGKGGTGKTTLSVNLASVAGSNSAILDCDVEEPNSHLFFNKITTNEEQVYAQFPEINPEKCINCGKCGNFCNFGAILNTKKTNIILKELCHDCGGCKIVCPTNAITFSKREIGRVITNKIDDKELFYGLLNTGEFSGTKVIQNVLKKGQNFQHRIIDAPPGSACPAVETVEGADLAIIVTEPTSFAFSDMQMVVEMLEDMKIETKIFINKSGFYFQELYNFCKEKNLEIIGELPYKKEYGENYAKGKILSEIFPEVKTIFSNLWEKITNEC